TVTDRIGEGELGLSTKLRMTRLGWCWSKKIDPMTNTTPSLFRERKNQGERKNSKITTELQQFKLGRMCDFGTANRDRLAHRPCSRHRWDASIPSLKRRGCCAFNKKSRSYLVPRRRGGPFGEMVRP